MTQLEQLDILLKKHGGMLYTIQVIAMGISKPIFYNYIRTRKMEQVAHGAWLVADTPKGATANAALYTFVESAKANHLDVEYLKYLLPEIPTITMYSTLKFQTIICHGLKSCLICTDFQRNIKNAITRLT